MSQKFKSELELQALNNATTDTDKFLVSDGGVVKYRTGAEMLSDLGVAPGVASNIQHQVKAGVAINKGQAVYVTSADGTNMIVGLASNASEATSSKTMGLLASTVSANGFANVITEGLLAGLNTIGATAGDPVWLGTGGNLIYGLLNKPYAPAHLVFIGIVTRVNANNGEIFVKVQNGFELNEIHDVDLKTTTPVNGHILGFDGTLWVNKTIAGWLGYTPYNASNPAGYISSYTETDTLASVTGRGNTTSNGLIATATESREVSTYLPSSYTTNDLVSGHNYKWYSDIWRLGATRSGAQPAADFVIQFNGSNRLNLTTNGNLTALADMRAPIFYDSNDTGYYLNPASTSNINAINISGNVGIGTTSPIHPLSVVGRIGGNIFGDSHIEFLSNGNTSLKANNSVLIGYSQNTVITQSGNVGIGTSSPATKLTVEGILATKPSGVDAYYSYLRSNWSADNAFELGISAFGSSIYHKLITSSGYYNGETLQFWTNDSERARFDISGNFGIGTTSPQERLHIETSNEYQISWARTGISKRWAFGADGSGTYLNNRTDSVLPIYVTNAGNVGIGTTSPSQKLEVSGIGYASSDFRAPIFYDANNTDYYVDLASTSDAAIRVRGGALHGPNPTWGKYLLVGGDGRQNYINDVNTASVCVTDGNLHIDAASGKSLHLNYYDGDYILLGNGASSTVSSINNDGSHRPQIVYDYNNTGYYLDPNNTSNLNIVRAANRLTGAWIGVDNTSSSTGNGISLYNGASSGQPTYGIMFAGTGTFGVHGTVGANDWATYFTMSDDITRGWIFRRGSTNVASISGGGVLQTSGYIYSSTYVQSGNSMYSPIYYDANNTGYYLDPASTSNCNVVNTGGYSNANYGFRIYKDIGNLASWPEGSHQLTLVNGDAGFVTLNFHRSGYTSNNLVYDGSLFSFDLSTRSSADFRAPVFYDSLDTSYYGDFSSTSRQYQAISFGDSSRYSAINTTINGAGAGDKLILYGGASNYDARLLVGADYDMLFKSQGNSSGKGSFKFYSGQNCTLAMTIDGSQYTSLTGGLSVAGNSSWFGGYGASSGLAFENQSSFARIVFWNLDFYEWDSGQIMTMNNGYVAANNSFRAPIFYDSNNTSYYVDPTSTTQINNLRVSTLDSAISWTDNAYMLASPTAGFRFNDSASNINAMIIDNSGNTFAYSSHRAPIFYDSNNTSFYVNPAGISSVSRVFYNNYLISQNSGGLMGDYNINGSASKCIWTIGESWPLVNMYGLAYEYDGTYFHGISLKWDGVTYSRLGLGSHGSFFTGAVTSGTSFKAPIFYDSNDTSYYFDGSNTGDSIRCAGDIVAYYSDERLKDKKGNIENALEKVLSLNGFYYEPNEVAQELGYKKRLEVGVSAQEVEAVLPELIKDAPIGQGYKTLDYGKLTPLLIEAVKEQQKQIEELKELVNKLINK